MFSTRPIWVCYNYGLECDLEAETTVLKAQKIAARSLIFSGNQRFQMPVATTRKRNNMCYSGAGRGNVRSVVSSSDKPCVVTALLELCQMFPGCS